MRTRTIFRCTECGADHPRWQGRCDSCGAWNTLVEETVNRTPTSTPRRQQAATPGPPPPRLREITSTRSARHSSGIPALDFVLGGGLVPGSMILVGGEPGIGKSTLLLQVAGSLTRQGARVLYVSGEESALQIKVRAERLDQGDEVELLCATGLEGIVDTIEHHRPVLAVVDSIQTVASDALEGAPGNVGQVRECAAKLMRVAKSTGVAIVVVGHVTRGGGIAGPMTLEHIVDTVLYFEGEGTADHRILRATKNRFGSIDEIAVFRMSERGLEGVENPSSLFLNDRDTPVSGSAVTALMEGSRPLLVEVQALAAKAGYGTPQRVATGFDGRRLSLLLAVLEKRAGLSFATLDVFLNVVGGLRMVEPSGDLAVAAALASSVYDRPIPGATVLVGEVGLGGEIRPVSNVERRLAEAAQLGFTQAFVSGRGLPRRAIDRLRVTGVDSIARLLELLFR